ncbi:MAG: putative ABC exporter domain-containing protein, partial [Atopobiaceae bacterium]|nr:putative ABC exporter domain-containing protein [Atopobiaceae bacterium]
MLLWVPSWMSAYGIGLYAALTFPLAWALTLCFSALFKIIAFELGSRHPFLRRNLRWFVIGALGLVGVLFWRIYDTSPARDLLTSAQLVFNAPWTRAVPVWGWVKGMVVFALEGRTAESLGMLGLCLALVVVLVVAAWRTKADYYEETLGWAEEMARFRERLASTNAPLLVLEFVRRGGNRGVEGFERGWGASVYFFKVLHLRKRFSRYGFVTKTMVTYLFAAVAAGLFTRHFMDEALPYIPAVLLAAMVFFRTVISPVTEDIRKDGFLMLPESIWAKLLFSLAGGACNCALDVAIPLVAGSVAAGFSPLEGLAYLPVLASADFFASASGAFVDTSIPPAIGVSLKQVAQVMLLYFGLIFDGMVVT